MAVFEQLVYSTRSSAYFDYPQYIERWLCLGCAFCDGSNQQVSVTYMHRTFSLWHNLFSLSNAKLRSAPNLAGVLVVSNTPESGKWQVEQIVPMVLRDDMQHDMPVIQRFAQAALIMTQPSLHHR